MLRWSPSYVLAKFGEVGSTHPWESSVSCAPPPKIAREHVLNRQQLSRGLFDFAHILYNFDHVPFDVPRTFKVNGSAVKVTAWHNVSASRKRYYSGTDKLSRVKLGENYHWVEHNMLFVTLHGVQGHKRGHKVKYWNRYKSAGDCSIAFTFGTECPHIICDTLRMLKVKGQVQGHIVKGQGHSIK